MKQKRMNKKIIIGGVLLILIAYSVGYALGFNIAIDYCMDAAERFLNIEIKPGLKNYLMARLGRF